MAIYNFLFFTIAIALLLSYFNYRFIGLHPTIAMMSSSLIIALLVILVSAFGYSDLESTIRNSIAHIDFHFLLMNCMLSFLLFAGSLNISVEHMKSEKWEITALSIFTTISSAFVISAALYYLLPYFAISVPFVYCMLFGALISPTDPIAVIAILRKLGVPKTLEVKLAGESLFNDGVGIVLFITTFTVAFTTKSFSTHEVLLIFFREALGGIVYGIIIGFVASKLIKNINNKNIIIFVTLAITTGAYALANSIGLSGALAMVVAGIYVGNCRFDTSDNDHIKEEVLGFWEVIDETLNIILFLLIGLELLRIHYEDKIMLSALSVIPIVLIARYLMIALPISLFKLKKQYYPNIIFILTWGGLRGGLAVALALSVPRGFIHDLIIQLTFAVVIFSILIQGTTIKGVVARTKPQ